MSIEVNLKRAEGFDCKEAIEKAIDKCIEQGILKKFLTNHRNEVMEVMTIDMTWERREELIRKEEYEEGKEDGIRKGKIEGKTEAILSLYKKGKLTIEEALEELEISREEFMEIISK